MPTLHLVSHTHWDREWYLTFQQFRFKLVNLVDDLLHLMETDLNYKRFMLDGQTIILNDYLQIRPEREAELRLLIQEGRLLIGPWYVLPDEFLVSSEAIVRNLLEGMRISQHFGPRMKVGYIPDPFGHIDQMPQILVGFGIQTACLRRGLDDQPCELWWRAPDGTSILLAYLRDGYDNAAALPVSDLEAFVDGIKKIYRSLSHHCATSHVLLMQGTDHMFPQPGTSRAIAYANQHLGDDTLIQSTLPEYLAAILAEVSPQENLPENQGLTIPTISGELRSSKRHHLLPGVLSTRMWIKQRNHACQTQLEKWAEPFSVFARRLGMPDSDYREILGFLRYTWRLLLENHPHDSICGCSIDQVHSDMSARFDQVDQVSAEIIDRSLHAISFQCDTRPPLTNSQATLALIVFNPSPIPRSEMVVASLPVAEPSVQSQIVDEDGQSAPFQIEQTNRRSLANLKLDRQGLFSLMGGVSDGVVTGLPIAGMTLQNVRLERIGDEMKIYVDLADSVPPNPDALSRIAPEMTAALADQVLQTFVLQADSISSQVSFMATSVPAFGYKTFWFCPGKDPTSPGKANSSVGTNPDLILISNEFLALEFSPLTGLFSLTDLRNGLVYPRLNYYIDSGDRGDEYNFCPPEQDIQVTPKVDSVQVETTPLKQSIRVEYTMLIPASLTPDRQARSSDTVSMPMTAAASLISGVPRLEFHTEIDNHAHDHRLRVHFASPFTPSVAVYDSHFEILQRPIGKPDFDETWVEEPRSEAPQLEFSAISDENAGILVANRGLPEIEVFSNPEGKAEIALTLLRSVGWLSRDDLSNRVGHAGPGLPTPGAQMPGHWAYDYALIPYSTGEIHSAIQQAYAFNAPLKAISSDLHAASCPSRSSFLNVEPQSFFISAIKPAEEDGFVLRGYNTLDEPIQVIFTPWEPLKSIYLTNLAEQIIEEVEPDPDGKIKLTVGSKKILTLLLR